MYDILPSFIGGLPGGMELAIILLLAVLLFGANKLPQLARSSGQAIGEFKRGREELEAELRESAAARENRDDETDTTESTA